GHVTRTNSRTTRLACACDGPGCAVARTMAAMIPNTRPRSTLCRRIASPLDPKGLVGCRAILYAAPKRSCGPHRRRGGRCRPWRGPGRPPRSGTPGGRPRAEPALQPGLDRGPLLGEDAVVDRVSKIAVRHDPVVTKHAFPHAPDALDRPLGLDVSGVGFECQPDQVERLEAVAQEQVLALRVDRGAPYLRREPGPPDLGAA